MATPSPESETLRRLIVDSLWQLGIRPPYSDQFTAGGSSILLQVTLPGRALRPSEGSPGALTHACRECEAEILSLFADLGRAATCKEIRAELKTRDKRFGVGIMRQTLARLVREGRLSNPRDKMGYRLTPDLP
jgi:hypothetical protein